MTAGRQGDAVTGGVHSLEVRWILPGRRQAPVGRWFARFPASLESREDTYLVDPHLPGLSVKIRGGSALEVKAFRGSPGTLDVAGRAFGHLESWQKWSFPCEPPSEGSGDPAGWTPVHKRRRISRFALASTVGRTHGPGPADEPGCQMEVVEVDANGKGWWSLGSRRPGPPACCEATGPASLLRGELDAAAALVFAQNLPGETELGADRSTSYDAWLRRQRPPR